MNKFLKIGHRGAAGYEPENTLRSFQKALTLRVDMIELDVRLSRDWVLVVIHDARLERTTNGRGRVNRHPWAELRLVLTKRGRQIPTLAQVLRLLPDKGRLNIDLKGRGTAEPVATLLNEQIRNKTHRAAQFLVSSYRPTDLLKFKKLCPAVATGLILGPLRLPGSILLAKKLKVQYLIVHPFRLNRKAVQKIHKRGLKLLVYTINDPATIETLKTLGVDGIFSDFPDRL